MAAAAVVATKSLGAAGGVVSAVREVVVVVLEWALCVVAILLFAYAVGRVLGFCVFRLVVAAVGRSARLPELLSGGLGIGGVVAVALASRVMGWVGGQGGHCRGEVYRCSHKGRCRFRTVHRGERWGVVVVGVSVAVAAVVVGCRGILAVKGAGVVVRAVMSVAAFQAAVGVGRAVLSL